MYKYAIRNGSLQCEWKDGLETAGRLGFDGVELIIKEEEQLDRLLTDEGRDEVQGWAKESGAAVSSLSPGLYNGTFKSKALRGDAETRARCVDFVKRCVRACRDVGGAGILLPYFEREHLDITADEQAWLVDEMKQCAPTAEECGVTLCLETSFSAGQLKAICEAVGSERVGVYQDLSNAIHFEQEPVATLRALGGHVKLVHVKDTDQSLLGEGRVDMPGCAAALREIGYSGWMVFETAPQDDPIASAKKNLAFAKATFGE